jgi:predicted ATPase
MWLKGKSPGNLRDLERMLDKENKVNAILDAWLAYIRLQDLSSAEVPSAEAECAGIKLSGNNLLIEEKVFDKLRRKRTTKETTWAVSFPQICKEKDGKSALCPLFSLDVTHIIQSDYQVQGWNIENFDLVEGCESLVLFSNLEEEKLERLITKEGLRRFLETTFDIEFQSFEDWMQKVSLQGHRIVKRPYLFEYKGSGFSFNLKKDLKAIKESQEQQWLQAGHPAYEYLFGIPKTPTHEILYLGAFPTHPPTDSQLKVLKHTQSEPITAVQGPPGSGKTTLILHLIAQQVVNRALSLIESGEDINNLTVVSSTNNRAVENVIERLHKDLPDSFFYLRGGSKTVIKDSDGAKEQLQNALEYLENSSFSETQQNVLAEQIKQLKQELIAQENQYQEMQHKRQADEARLSQLQEEIQETQQQIVDTNIAKDKLKQEIAEVASYEHLPEQVYSRIQSQFNTVELPGKKPSRWINWLYQLLGKTEEQILKKMVSKCQTDINKTLETQFKIESPIDRDALVKEKKHIEERLTCWENLKAAQAALKKLSLDIVHIDCKSEEQQRELLEIEQRLAVPLTDFYSTFHTQYHEQHCSLFRLSQQFLVQEALKRKNDVKDALERYLKILSDESSQTGMIIPDKLCKTLSLMFPVITCTLLSIRNMLPWKKECVDRVIVDESGMIPLHYAFPLLVRSRKAIVVGDPLQIEPIVDQSQQTLKLYFEKNFIGQGLTQEDYDCFSPSQIDTATTYHRAAGTTGQENDVGHGIRLLEHYRCQPNIIAYCERIAKYGLIAKTDPQDSRIVSNLVAYHVDGNITKNINQEEIIAIHEIIQNLLKQGYALEEIGVISAFRAQANALEDSLVKKFPGFKDKNAIGTVHTFQGSERRVIILSTKVCRPQHSINWINRRPNLLNVAVSRAKELFILVGNLHRLEDRSGEYTRQLVEHIREQGVILEYKTAAEVNPERFSSSGSSLIYDCDHLTTLEEAMKKAEKELYLVAPRIQGEAAQKFGQDVTLALKRGIHVTVVYGYPNDGNHLDERQENQAEKRLQELFAKYPGASLIRAKGDGTNERILMCDNKFAVIGSWNWLSHVYLSTCQQQKMTAEVQIRRETSVLLSEPSLIESVRETITELMQESL